jgi:hypothetical protein
MKRIDGVTLDLIEACKAAQDFVVGLDGAQTIWEQLRAAIRKAEGSRFVMYDERI